MKDAGDIFKFMYTNKIGEDLALFYMAWAYVTERAGNFSFTENIYTKGINRYYNDASYMHARLI